MNIGDLIYSIITLILMVLIMMSPLLRKIFKSAEKHAKGNIASSEDSFYESVDSHRVVNRILEEVEPVPHMDFIEPEKVHSLVRAKGEIQEKMSTPLERLDKMPPLKKAVIWKEILDKPVGLRNIGE